MNWIALALCCVFSGSLLATSGPVEEQPDSVELSDEVWQLYGEAREKPDSTRAVANTILSERRETISPEIESYLYEIIGDCYYMTSTYDSALQYMFQARMLMEANGDTISLAYNSDYLGNVYHEMGLQGEAAFHYSNARKTFTRLEDSWGLSLINYGLSLIYFERDDLDRSLEYALASYEHTVAGGDSVGLPSVNTQLASIQNQLGNYDSALELVQTALRQNRAFNSGRSDRCFGYGAAAEVYVSMEKYDLAQSYIDSAYTIAVAMGDVYAGIYLQTVQASVLAGKGNDDDALNLLYDALSKSNEHRLIVGKRAAYKAILSLARERNDWKLAIDYADSLTDLTQKVFDDNLQLMMLEDELKSERARVEKLRVDNQLSELRDERNLLILVIVGILSLITFIALIIQWRSNIRSNELNLALKNNNDLIKSQNAVLEKQRNTLEQNQILLQQSIRDKDKLLTLITHDLRSPLAQVKSVSELILDGLITPEEQQQFFTKIHESVDKSLENITDVLVWAKSQMDEGIKASKRNVQVGPLLDRAYSMVDYQYMKKSVSLKIECANPSPEVHCDPSQLETIFRNVLSNAAKFSHKNGEVIASVLDHENTVEVVIQDFGVGMSPIQVQSIIGNGSYSSSRGTDREEGTGAGLQLVKDFLAMVGGKMRIESEEGKGTKVILELEK